MSDTDPRPAATGEPPAGDADRETAELRSISPQVQFLWGISALATGLAVAVVVGGAAAAWTTLPVWTGPALGLVVAAVGVAMVRLRYRAWGFQLRPEELYLERGVLTHVRTIVPFVRIQHVDTQRGPVERALGLSTLVVYTAGSRGADVSIPGLEPAEARQLQARLKELAVDAEGGDAV